MPSARAAPARERLSWAASKARRWRSRVMTAFASPGAAARSAATRSRSARQPGAGLCRDGRSTRGRGRRGEIAFGADPQPRRRRRDTGVIPAIPAIRSREPEHEIGLLNMRARARNAFNLNRIACVAQTRRVDESHRQSTEVAAHLDGVAGGAGDRRHDGDVAARDGVEKGRLSGVRRAGEDDREALAQTLAATALGEVARQFFRHVFPNPAACSSTPAATSGSSEKSSAASSSARHSISRSRQLSTRLPSRPSSWRRAWRRCASVSASMRSARPSTAERSIRPLRKARRVNSPGSAARQPGRPASVRSTAARDRKTAVEVKLGLVLAGEALRPRHPDDERLVERFAGGGVAKHRERHPPRRRQAAGHGLEHAGACRARSARTTAIAARPAPEAGAKMVSSAIRPRT